MLVKLHSRVKAFAAPFKLTFPSYFRADTPATFRSAFAKASHNAQKMVTYMIHMEKKHAAQMQPNRVYKKRLMNRFPPLSLLDFARPQCNLK
jgi:hypothetical protein